MRTLVILVPSALCLLALESHLRRSQTYVVQHDADAIRGLRFVEQDPEFLILQTPRGRRLVPNADVVIRHHALSGRDIPMRINGAGFRGPEVPATKGRDELRVLVLGDSITWGDYLLEDETWVRRLEVALRTAIPGRPVTAINAGVGDVGLQEELDILEERGLALRPDVVVLELYLNDSRPPWGFAGELGGRGWLRRHSLIAESVYRNVRLFRWLNRQGRERFQWIDAQRRLDWRRDRDEFLRLADLARDDWGAAWQPDSWGTIRDGFARLRALSQQHGFRVAVVSFPVSYQIESDFLEDTPQRTMQEIAGQFDFPFHDLLPLLRPHASEALFYDQCHLRPPANDLVGRTVADFLVTRLTLR